MNQNQIIGLIVLLILIFIVGFFILTSNKKESIAVTNFEECVAAGYAVLESYPRQCNTPEGRNFVEKVDSPVTSKPTTSGGCYVGGCSQQICSDSPDAVSTCEYRTEYACYGSATCERQGDGKCGWTQTSALRACLGGFVGSDTSGK